MAALILCIIVTSSGCGSKADKAAQQLLDVSLEAKKMKESGKPEQVLELMGRMMEAAKVLKEETAKMSPDELAAFNKKWEQRFKDAGMPIP